MRNYPGREEKLAKFAARSVVTKSSTRVFFFRLRNNSPLIIAIFFNAIYSFFLICEAIYFDAC